MSAEEASELQGIHPKDYPGLQSGGVQSWQLQNLTGNAVTACTALWELLIMVSQLDPACQSHQTITPPAPIPRARSFWERPFNQHSVEFNEGMKKLGSVSCTLVALGCGWLAFTQGFDSLLEESIFRSNLLWASEAMAEWARRVLILAPVGMFSMFFLAACTFSICSACTCKRLTERRNPAAGNGLKKLPSFRMLGCLCH